MATAGATDQDREKYEEWLRGRIGEEDITRGNPASRNKGWWRTLWEGFGGDLLFAACAIGVITALMVIYKTLETAGWFRL